MSYPVFWKKKKKKTEKNITNLKSAELAQRAVKVKVLNKIVADDILFLKIIFFRENKELALHVNC